jgi:cell pole-organizing protein PopZ
MPDPVKNAEIEDVLSSIRRLVADDAPAPMEPPATPKAEGADKLVLTPALRIQPQENKVEEPADAKAVPTDDWEEVTLEDRIAELEAAVASSDEEYEPDGSEVEASAPAMDLSAFEDDTFELSPEHAVAPEPEPEAEPEVAETEAAKAVEDAVAEAEEEPAEATSETSEDNVFEDDLSEVFDEEMLRDLVSEFVRKELQGELGERITRNVRKLVRREINRALAARDFD